MMMTEVELHPLIFGPASSRPGSTLCCGTHRGNRRRCPLQTETNHHKFIPLQRDGKTDDAGLLDKGYRPGRSQ